MKTKKRSITLFSFFPAVALLATPLLFSTLAPATIDSSDWIVPQSFMTTDEILEAANVNNKEIGEVRFLDYGDSIYGGGENASSLISSSPAILDSGEVETAYVLQNPEFQRQVSDLQSEAKKAGAQLPPLLTLVALFAFAVATGTSSLEEFFKFSTYTDKVKKTIQVTKKVAKTVYKTITETIARKVKTIKTVAYTAYETVKNVAYNTRTWLTEVVKHKPITWHPLEQMEMKAKFLLDNINKYQGKFTRSYAKNVRYYTPNLSEYAYLKKEYDDVASGRKVGRYAQNVQHRVWDERQTLDSQAGQFFDGIADPKLREKLLSEYKSLNDVTYTEKTTHSETTPVVTYVEKPYTAYRDEVETKIVYDTISREVPETIYEDVIENHEVVEDVTKYAFTPLNDKIDLAMNYLKNYSRILQRPSNRNFADDALLPNRDLSIFAGAYDVYEKLGVELKNANVYNMDRTDPEGVKEILKRHNEFIYSMKTKLAQIEQGKTPEEQMGILFGKTYTDSIRESENAIAQAEAEEKAISARFEEIGEMERIGKISEGYSRTLYNSAKRNRDQLYRRKRDAIKNLKEGKEYYSRRFNGTISSLQNLSFLRSLEDWRNALAYGERSTAASRLVPFTTASGSTIYRRANATTTTQAQPKKTIPQPADLTTANANSQKSMYVDLGGGVAMLNGSVLKNGKFFTVEYSSQETTKMYEMAKKMARQDLPDANKDEVLQHADDLYASFLLTDKILRAKGQTPLVTLSNFEETLYGVRNRVVYGERNADNTTAAKVLNTTFDAAYIADMIIGGVYLVKGIKNIPKVAKALKTAVQTTKITGKNAIQKAVMHTDLRGAKINGKIEIPKDWVRIEARGEGWIYHDPKNSENLIRIMKSGTNSKFPNYAQSYMQIKRNGLIFDINLSSVPKKSEAAHIIINQITL